MESPSEQTGSTLRSLVRPISPLSSRISKTMKDRTSNESVRHKKMAHRSSRSRSRSPLLASTVHLANNRSPSPSNRRSKRRARSQHQKSDDLRSRSYKHINRNQVCPILIRLFWTTNGHHNLPSAFNRGRLPANELQLNTWIDCTLRELAEEIREVCPLARRRGSRIHFVIVYPDKHGTYRRRELGAVVTGLVTTESSGVAVDSNEQPDPKNFNLADDSDLTLLSRHFHIGDYLDVSVTEHVPGSLGGWTTGRRPLGPTPASSRAAARLL